MSLLDRKKEFPHPTSPSFNPGPWRDLLDSREAGARDKGVAKIALIVGQMFDAVREGSKGTLTALPADRGLRIGSYLAYLNSAAIEITARGKLLGGPDENPFTTALHEKIKDISPSGSLAVDEGLAGLVDSARFPLFELMHRADEEFSGSEASDLKEAISFHIRAGQHYLVWHDVWQDVICRELFLDQDNHLSYGRKDLVQCAVVADYRVRRKLLTLAFSAEDAWQRAPGKYKADYRDVEVRAGADGCLRFKRSRQVPDSAPFQFMMRIAAEMEISASALKTVLPKYGDVSILEMIACWRTIATAISSKVEDQVDAVEKALRSEADWSITPSDVVFCFNRLELIADLSKVTGISQGRVAHIVNAMKFSGVTVSSLWGNPLVEISEDRLLVVNTPFVSGGYLYPVRAWTSEGGGDQHEKGYAFEDELFDEFSNARKTNIHISHWKFLQDATVNCMDRKEQIDLLLFTSTAVYVIEAKCFIPGYEPREVVRYMGSLEKAVEQARRKARNVDSSRVRLKDFLAGKKVAVSLDLSTCPVHPMVVTYHPLGAGAGPADCPIVDLTTIEKFLGNEEPAAIVRTGGETKRVGRGKWLYTSKDGADALFFAYMKAPPILEGYKRQVVVREIPLMGSDGSASGMTLDYFDMAPDQVELEYFKKLLAD